jgi:SOS-response transcriptional repressor LexA
MQADGQDQFTKRDLCRKVRKLNAESIETALTVLEECGYIRRDKISTGGRPTDFIELNPVVKRKK